MTDQQAREKGTYIGLLECPLRRGFLEFEYRSGDLVVELLRKIAHVWGRSLFPYKGLLPFEYRSWSDDRMWAILCQDEDGAYVSLKPQDKIPTRPPTRLPLSKPDKVVAEVTVGGADLDISLDSDYDILGKPRERALLAMLRMGAHVGIKINRDYELPNDSKYDIRMIALAAVVGG